MSYSDWIETTWGELVTLEYGKSLRDYPNHYGNIPIFGTNGQIGYTDKALCPFPSVIVGRKGAYRGIHYSEKPFFVIDTAFYIKPRSTGLDLKFAYYQLLTQDINGMDSGSAIPSTSREDFYSLSLKLPDFVTQTRIAAILSALDDKIELNRRTNATLEAIAQAIFKEWFVDFHFPGATGEMQDSELGPIPKGWRVGKVGEICEVNKNSISKKDVFEYIKYIEISEVTKGIVGKTSIYPYGTEPSRAKRKLKHGDTVLSTVRPNRGSYFLALNPPPNLIASTGFAIFSPTKVPPSFLYLFLTSSEKLEYYGHVADGGAYPAINPGLIMDIDIIIPDNDALKLFLSVTDRLFQEIDNNHNQSSTLAQTRDTLLPKLMSGEIEV